MLTYVLISVMRLDIFLIKEWFMRLLMWEVYDMKDAIFRSCRDGNPLGLLTGESRMMTR